MVGVFFGFLHDNVDLLFNIINVILLLAIVYFVFKKYMLPSLKEKFYEHLYYEAGLKDKANNLVQDQRELKVLTEKQVNLCNNLKDKVERWTQEVLKDREQYMKERQAIDQRIKESVSLQSKNYAQQMMLRQVIPHVKEKIEVKLNNYFDKNDHSSDYVKKVLNYIKE